MFQVLNIAHAPQHGLASVSAQGQTCAVAIRITHHTKQVQYVEPQEDNFIFSRQYLRNCSTPDISIFRYIDVI